MRRAAVAVLPVVALLLVALAAVFPATVDEPRAAREVEVEQSRYACPAGDGRTIAATQVEPGREAEALTVPDGDPVEDLRDPARYRTAQVGAPDLLVRQDGAGTGGVGFAAGTEGGELALAACPSVVDEAWFTGLGSTTDHSSTLVLTNLADAPAVADLTLWSPDGPVDAVDAEGVVVEPFQTRRVSVADLAAGEDDLSVHLERRRGALSAVAVDSSPDGGDLVPTAAAPASSLVIGGLPATSADRILRLVNPTGTTARVDVRVLGEDGTFVPEELSEVEVGAGRTRTVELPAALAESASSLVLDANTRITGAVQTVGQDTAVTPAAQPWTGTAVVPLELGGPALGSIVLSAPGADGRVSVAAVDEEGQELDSARVEVAGGGSVEVDADELLDAGDAVALLLRSEGDVLGSAGYAQGRGLASLPLTAAPVTAEGPAVRWGAPSR
ncbi:DUF5719 family protein [Aeromicrobium sp. CF4.19]|uniref:DUF5719 family protein n=1 Tax=Aeromicrobium sp. CF4.19 TaxID=3373082 RepID=UPI003EE54A9F